MSGQRPPFLIGPAFLGVLRFKRAAEYVFNTRTAAARKAFFDERFKVGGTFNCMADSPLSLSSEPFSAARRWASPDCEELGIGTLTFLEMLQKTFCLAQFAARVAAVHSNCVCPVFVPGSVQPHLRVTSAQAILKNVGGGFAAWQNLSTD